MGSDDEGNPFRLPPDDQIFLIREQERQRRAVDRERAKTQRVWEKTTATSRVQKTMRNRDNTDEVQLQAEGSQSARRAHSQGFGGREVRREKENIAEFVAKKREMFLVQMSLDVKKAEILKLDERAKQKEEALKKSQQMLEEDVSRFDAFLQSNDQKAHKAMKNAEEMTKKKQDRLQKIKQLKSQLSALQSEIAKHREQKDECLKYKSFLEKLTPLEWKEAVVQEKLERKRRRKKAKVDRKMVENQAKMQSEIEAEERAMEEKAAEQAKSRRRQRREVEEEQRERERELEARRRRIRKKYPARDAVEAEVSDDSSGEELPLYFQEPKQLLDVFVSLEESNLFLIQNSQDTEQALEELQQKFADTRKNSEAARDKVRQAVVQLERQIEDERGKCEELKGKLAQKRGSSEQEELLADLTGKTLEVYTACGHEADHDPDALVMLAAIEAKLEEHLNVFEEAEAAGLKRLVEELEKKYEINRRGFVKRQRKEQSDQKIDERLKASLQRSQAPIYKKTGKPIMRRSAPLCKARRVVQEDDGYEEAVNQHHIFGIWTGKDGAPNAAPPTRPG
mmetsp:Transcript_127127/g.368035  ORF Transcript_127127/g.368035 Transcript_127127/m.368035 type:complete len:566 (-) Transcript_127127:56-1753(-)